MYSNDVRRIALRLYEQLSSLRKVAGLLGTSHSTVSRWLQAGAERPSASPRPGKLRSPAVLNAIALVLSADPFATVADVQRALAQQLNIPASAELVRLAMRRAGFSRKRARWHSEPRDDPARLQQFLAARTTFVAQGRRFVSIDETSFGRNCQPAMGYARRGRRLRLVRPTARMTNVSVVAAVALGEPVRHSAREGSFSTEPFAAFLNSLPFPPRTVLLLDNVSFHHSRRVAEVCAARGWDLLFVPPYSPVFNPIEGVFSVVKRHYHRHRRIEPAFASVTSAQVAGFFRGSFQAQHR